MKHVRNIALGILFLSSLPLMAEKGEFPMGGPKGRFQGMEIAEKGDFPDIPEGDLPENAPDFPMNPQGEPDFPMNPRYDSNGKIIPEVDTPSSGKNASPPNNPSPNQPPTPSEPTTNE